jgi:surfactin synthase thioesterase subunit
MTSQALNPAAAAGPWLRRFVHRHPAQLRLVCFPHAGGSAAFYRGWHRHTPDWIDVVAVQYPGRQDRRAEPCLYDLAAMGAGAAAAVIAEAGPPVALFGHGMGATVAYEAAVRMQRRGHAPVQLLVSGQASPARHRAGALHRLPDVEPSAARADQYALESYRAPVAPLLRCPITSYYGLGDPAVTEGEAGSWYEVTEGRFQLCPWPGDHFYLVCRERHLVTDVSSRLAALTLDAA